MVMRCNWDAGVEKVRKIMLSSFEISLNFK